ncbi:MAG: hypothetical protein ACQGVK_01285 [Myxococcota bacterium]
MKRSLRSLLRVLGVALLVPIVPFLLVGELPGERWLSGTDESAFWFGLSGSGLLAGDILLPVPSTIVGTLLGARLGWWPGWLWAWAGLVAGNGLGFAAGRLWLFTSELEIADRPTGLLIFATRPVPILAEAVVIAAGAAGVAKRSFLAASVAGNGLFAAAMAANGATLLPDRWAGPGLALPMLLPLLAWGAWVVYRRRAAVGRTGTTG